MYTEQGQVIGESNVDVGRFMNVDMFAVIQKANGRIFRYGSNIEWSSYAESV